MGVYDIQGKNCVFQLKIGDEYLTVVCAKSFTFNPVTDMKETTTVGSSFWKEFRPRKLSYTISFSGMLQVASLITQEKVKTLFDYQIQFLPIVYRMLYYDNSNNVMNVNGTAYVSSNLFDASPVNLVNTTTELQGTGAIEILDVIPDTINLTVQMTGEADAKARFVLYDADGNIKYDTSTLDELLPYSGWLVQGVTVIIPVQKGSYAWAVSTDDVQSDVNTFDLDISPPVHIDFDDLGVSQNSLPTTFSFITDKSAIFDIGPDSPPPSCVAVAFGGSTTLPDGTEYQIYTKTIPLTGSPTFSLSNVTKPSWMSITIHESPLPGSGSWVIEISGVPGGGAAGFNIPVSFDVTNACGSVSISDTIDIASSSTINTINYSHSIIGGPGTLKIYVNGSLAVQAPVGASSSITVNNGDVVQAIVTGSVTYTKNLEVESDISGTLYNNSGTSTQSYSFTTLNGHEYTITSSITP